VTARVVAFLKQRDLLPKTDNLRERLGLTQKGPEIRAR
jgi:hypothetical protein